MEDLKELPNVECIAEKMIDFKNELAVVVARNSKGEVMRHLHRLWKFDVRLEQENSAGLPTLLAECRTSK